MRKPPGTPPSRPQHLPGDAVDLSPAQQSDAKIQELDDWRGQTLARVRTLIHEADPAVDEEWKWRGVPVWSHAGVLCTGEVYQQVVKLTFARGAALEDPAGLFNASLDNRTRRAIDLRAGDKLNAAAFKRLIRSAVALNASGPRRASRLQGKATKQSAQRLAKQPRTARAANVVTSRSKPPQLLSGGNPQIAKGDGDGPVQAFIAAMPGWKAVAGRQLDALIESTVPQVQKAVRWNTPFYGIAGQGWFLGFHCCTKYIKVAFLRGSTLRPLPPVGSKDPHARYFHIDEHGDVDAAQLASWIRQAAEQPGDPLF